MHAPYPCPCCGFLVFEEPSGSFEICPLCGWEDDSVQLQAPGYAGGANAESLCEAQRRGGWHLLRRDLFQGYRRLAAWRPLSDAECARTIAAPMTGERAQSPYYWDGSRPGV